jgi:hypothetical protein
MPYNILFLGDVMLGENHDHIARGILTNYHPDYSLLAQPVREELLNNIDAVFYNLEYSFFNANINDKLNYSSVVYRSHIESLNLFGGDKIKIVNIANNHFSQHQSESSRFTKDILALNNFIVIGNDNTPHLISKDNNNIFMWGVSLIKDKYYCNEYFYSTYKNLLNDLILPVKEKNDKWIISVHWGDEYIRKPSLSQINLGHKLIESGFDIVIGHHPHVIQPIEFYKNGIICYSLGNFIFDQNYSFRTRKGLGIKTIINNNIAIEGIYHTYQKNYLVTRAKKNNNTLTVIKPVKFYKSKLKFINYIMRLLMKFELLLHLNTISDFTLEYYRDKIKSKYS